MDKRLFKKVLTWGLLLWFIGYLLGIILFMFVPQDLVGWIIMPIGSVFLYWVVNKKINTNNLSHYLYTGIIWTMIAVIFDYLFIVKLFNSADYYKTDVYLYYLLTLFLPLLIKRIQSK